MYQKAVVLRPETHRDITVSPTSDWSFAANEQVVPLVFSEMAAAAREYPIVFLPGKPLFYALVALQRGNNAYIDARGAWRATYVPARLRAYPFGLTQVPDQPERFVLVVDQVAPQLAAPGGTAIYRGSELSDAMKARLELLTRMQKAEPITQRLVQAIRDAGLLVTRSIKVQGEEKPTLGGFEVIDEKALNSLSNDAYVALRETGAMPLVYAHLLSMANLRQGALAGRHPELSQPEGAAAGGAKWDAEELFTQDADELRFDFDD